MLFPEIPSFVQMKNRITVKALDENDPRNFTVIFTFSHDKMNDGNTNAIEFAQEFLEL